MAVFKTSIAHTADQMGVVPQKLLKKGDFFRGISLVEFPSIGWQHTPGRIKAALPGPLEVDLHGLLAAALHQVGVGDLCLVRQGHIGVHHSLRLLRINAQFISPRAK